MTIVTCKSIHLSSFAILVDVSGSSIASSNTNTVSCGFTMPKCSNSICGFLFNCRAKPTILQMKHWVSFLTLVVQSPFFHWQLQWYSFSHLGNALIGFYIVHVFLHLILMQEDIACFSEQFYSPQPIYFPIDFLYNICSWYRDSNKQFGKMYNNIISFLCSNNEIDLKLMKMKF